MKNLFKVENIRRMLGIIARVAVIGFGFAVAFSSCISIPESIPVLSGHYDATQPITAQTVLINMCYSPGMEGVNIMTINDRQAKEGEENIWSEPQASVTSLLYNEMVILPAAENSFGIRVFYHQRNLWGDLMIQKADYSTSGVMQAGHYYYLDFANTDDPRWLGLSRGDMITGFVIRDIANHPNESVIRAEIDSRLANMQAQ